MDIWYRLEIVLRQIMKINQQEALSLGFRAQYLEIYFGGSVENATKFLEAMFALRKHKKKYHQKRCQECRKHCLDPVTGIIFLRAGQCDECFQKKWGSLQNPLGEYDV